MAETWNKKEREKKKKKLKQEKIEKRQGKKDNAEPASEQSMYAYLDENGNLSDTPPDPKKKIIIKAEDIEIGVPKYEPAGDGELIRTGNITFFNHDKGFGFIEDSQSKESVFVHINALAEPVKEGNKVSFEVEMGPRGSNAINVKLVK